MFSLWVTIENLKIHLILLIRLDFVFKSKNPFIQTLNLLSLEP